MAASTMSTRCPCCGTEHDRFAYFVGCGHFACGDCYAEIETNDMVGEMLFECYDCEAPVMEIIWAGSERPTLKEPSAVTSRARWDDMFADLGYDHRLCVVVHCRTGDAAHAVEQTTVAFKNGADGVFLIIHKKHDRSDLLLLYDAVRAAHPQRFIGLNFLFARADQAMENVPLDCQALWTDDGIDGKAAQNGVDAQIPRALGIRVARQWPGLLFAAFAFKYREMET